MAAIVILGAALDAIGPFGPHPGRPYATFLADFEGGQVSHIAQWRDRLEVTEGTGTFLVAIPDGADVQFDLATARLAGGVGMDLEIIPDEWLALDTPWVPGLLLVAGFVIWLRAVLRRRADGQTRLAVPALHSGPLMP